MLTDILSQNQTHKFKNIHPCGEKKNRDAGLY